MILCKVETTNDANKARCEAQQMVEPFPEFIHPLQDAEGAEGEKVVWGLSRKSKCSFGRKSDGVNCF